MKARVSERLRQLLQDKPDVVRKALEDGRSECAGAVVTVTGPRRPNAAATGGEQASQSNDGGTP